MYWTCRGPSLSFASQYHRKLSVLDLCDISYLMFKHASTPLVSTVGLLNLIKYTIYVDTRLVDVELVPNDVDNFSFGITFSL